MSNAIKMKSGWKVLRFDQIATNVNVRIDNPSESGMAHYVGLEHLDPDSLRIRRWGSPDDVEATKLCFKKGDIIFGRRRAYQRKLGVAEFDGICSAHAMVLRAKADVVLPEFLPFFMQSDLFMNRAVEISVGSLSPTINWKMMAIQEFVLPPITEQKKIITLLSECEEVMQKLEVALLAATKLLSSLSISTFSGEVQRRVLSDFVIESMYGPRFSNSLYDKGGLVAQLRTTDISDSGEIDYAGIPRANLVPRELTAHLLRAGDLVYSRSGTCGVTAVFDEQLVPTVPAAFLIRFRLKEGLDPHYLNEFFHSPIGRQMSASLARGGVQQNVSASELMKQLVPVPPENIQISVVENFKAIRNTSTEIESRLEQMTTLKKTILRIALQGIEDV